MDNYSSNAVQYSSDPVRPPKPEDVPMKSNYAMTTSDSIVSQPKSHLNSVISCHLCSRTFSHEGYLKMHMRSHLSEKIYVCQICSKTFTRQGHLKVHMKTHVSSSMTKSKPG
eukprot:676726_1